MMNLPQPPNRFHIHEEYICSVAEEVRKQSMRDAVEEGVISQSSRDLCVTLDGSWQKRGHTSLNGVISHQ